MNHFAQRYPRLFFFFTFLIAVFAWTARAQNSSPSANALKGSPTAGVQTNSSPVGSQRNANNPSLPATPPVKPTVPPPNNSAKSPLILVGDSTLVLDPACNACQGAPMDLIVTAPGSLKVPQPLQLRAEHLVADTGTDMSSVKISIEPKNLPTSITPGKSISFRVVATGVLPIGKWRSELFNGSESLGPVYFVVPKVPLNFKVDTADSSPPSITLTRDETTRILLKNDDAVGYPIEWTFHLASSGSADEHKDIDSQSAKGDWKTSKLPANGEVALEIKPDGDWFTEAGVNPCWWISDKFESALRVPCNWRAVFKDKEAEGLLTLRLQSPPCPGDPGAPVKIIRAKVALAYYSAPKKAFWSYLVILFLLFAGAVTSLYVNYKFPDEQIRADLRKQLAQSVADVQDLSMRLAPRLRVLVGVASRLLHFRLRDLKWYTTEFEKERGEIADGSAKLSRRVSSLRLMGRLRESYEGLMTLDVPPALMDNFEASFEQIGGLLDDFQVLDADLQEAEVRLADLRKEITGWAQPDTTLAGQISAALQSLYKDLQPPAGLISGSVTFNQIIAVQFPDPVRLLRIAPPNPGDISANDYYRFDCLAFRGNLLRTYALLCDSRNPGPESPLLTRRDELFRKIKSESWDGLRKARRLVEEMSEEVYSDDIKREIIASRVEIRLDRNDVRCFEAALFYLKFHNDTYDTAAAKDEWSCTWNFGHGPFPGKPSDPTRYLEEQGWKVAHFFREEKNYTLTARFRHEEEGDLKDATGAFVGPPPKIVEVGKATDEPEFKGRAVWLKKSWWKTKRWLGGNGNAVLRLLLALVPAILGMVAGAKDQFLKMDLYLGLGSIFLLGFGSDTVKNLLSQNPKPTAGAGH